MWQEAEIHEQYQEDIFIDDFVAPSNDLETTLANIWSEVLGCGENSVNDNFLEVGGDSLLSIRILARINKAGLSIATEDVFEYPTIAEQAKVIKSADNHSYEKGSTTGAFSLIPIQSWLFERIKIDPQHWNQTLLLSASEHLDLLSLERALQKLLSQHDALRSVFDKNLEGKWQQTFMPLSSHLPLQIVNISNTTAEQQNQQILHEMET
jgi:aryl carrier-like protein